MALGYILADYGYDAKEVTTAVQSAYQNTAEHNTDTFQPKKTRVINESKKNRSLSEVEVNPEPETLYSSVRLVDLLSSFLIISFNKSFCSCFKEMNLFTQV